MRRLMGLLLALALGFTPIALPAHAATPALQVVGAVAKYVGLTTAFAEALAMLTRAVESAYAAGTAMADDLSCRSQKSALEELVVALRRVEGDKRILHGTLSRAVYFPHRGDWHRLAGLAERVNGGIARLEQQLDRSASALAGGVEMSRAYRDLMVAFEAKKGILRELAAEMVAVDWNWPGIDDGALRPHLRIFGELEADLARQLQTIGSATDSIAARRGDMCTPTPASAALD